MQRDGFCLVHLPSSYLGTSPCGLQAPWVREHHHRRLAQRKEAAGGLALICDARRPQFARAGSAGRCHGAPRVCAPAPSEAIAPAQGLMTPPYQALLLDAEAGTREACKDESCMKDGADCHDKVGMMGISQLSRTECPTAAARQALLLGQPRCQAAGARASPLSFGSYPGRQHANLPCAGSPAVLQPCWGGAPNPECCGARCVRRRLQGSQAGVESKE